MRALAFILLAALLPFDRVLAEQYQDFGAYRVYYNAFTADFLAPSVARQYGIQRSSRRGVLNITVRRLDNNEPARAKVTGKAINLSKQVKPIEVREITEPGAIYYIADFGVDNGETLDFRLEVRPEGAAEALELGFRQQFFSH